MELSDLSNLPLVCLGIVVGLFLDHPLQDSRLRPAVWAFIGGVISLGISDIALHVNLANRPDSPSILLRYVSMAASVVAGTRFYGLSERTAIIAIVSILIGTLVATLVQGAMLRPHRLLSETFEPTIACSFTVFVLALLFGEGKRVGEA